MKPVLAIRAEDISPLESRCPLVPADVRWLREQMDVRVLVESSAQRVFSDDAFAQAGAEITDDLREARIILGVKEVPVHKIMEGKTYLFFSHTIKGQAHNMPLLQRILDAGCDLIDYERMVDAQGRRLVFFGRFAGLAGMVETLHALGRKWALQGRDTPLAQIRQPYRYASLADACADLDRVAALIEEDGFPEGMDPVVVAFTGNGNVSRGAQEIFRRLPHQIMSPSIIDFNYENLVGERNLIYQVVFQEEDLFARKDGGTFDLQEYYHHPELYRCVLDPHLRHITALVNGIYWEPRYPRILTRSWIRNEGFLRSFPNPQVVGDISCDIGGSVEITHKACKPDEPCYTCLPTEDRFVDGVDRAGVSVMAVDNLPCEFGRESSLHFSESIRPWLPALIRERQVRDNEVPEELRRATLVRDGLLTDDYAYLSSFLGGKP